MAISLMTPQSSMVNIVDLLKLGPTYIYTPSLSVLICPYEMVSDLQLLVTLGEL